ncbi:MAG: hypothetical protein C0592_08245 [Marinilabiliales bacterium]|nr:MAG: hypothetical protein C0592_08245 [Marinilabiliales bacterium]
MKKSLILFILVLAGVFAYGQEKYAIKLTHKDKPEKVRYIYEGKRMMVIMPDGTKHKGKLEFLSSADISLNGTEIPCDNIPVIKGQSTGLLMGKIFGGVLIAGGLLFTGAGGAMIISGFAEQSLAGIILIPFGIVVAAGGVGSTLMGTTILFFTGKKYDLENDWDMEVVKVSES